MLLIGTVQRAFHIRELYSIDGAPSPLWINYGTAQFLPDLAPAAAVSLYAALVVSLLAVMAGWMTRISLITACVLYVCFGMLDSISTLTKYTVIAAHILMLLTLSECGAVWSVDAWLAKRSQTARSAWPGPPTFPVWPRRLLQLFIGIVYVGAAITKMHTPAYFSGDQLTSWMLADLNMDNRLGEWLTLYPPLITVMAYVTILWEILFVVLIWSPFWRLPALFLGVVFHVMTYFTLGLVDFPLIYLAAYCAYLEPNEIERAALSGRRVWRRLGLPGLKMRGLWLTHTDRRVLSTYSLAAWTIVMLAAAVLAVEVEHHSDVYGRRSPDGPQSLKALDKKLVGEMLSPAKRLRPQDMYFAFDVGTATLGGFLSDRRESFRHGEQAIVQCSLQPPHPDMWVEVNLHDSDNRVIKRIGQVVPRENLRAEFYYPFDQSLEPGTYDFVLRYDGRELTRRSITLSAARSSALALSSLSPNGQ